MITARPLRLLEERLREFGDQVQVHGNGVGGARLTELADRVAALARELDKVLSRLGDPPTEGWR